MQPVMLLLPLQLSQLVRQKWASALQLAQEFLSRVVRRIDHTGTVFCSQEPSCYILNVAVVAAVSFVTDVRLARRSFARDVLFFILTIIYLLIVTLDGVITLAEASGFAIIYILFITVVAGGRWIRALRTEDEGSSAFGSAGGEGPGSVELFCNIFLLIGIELESTEAIES